MKRLALMHHKCGTTYMKKVLTSLSRKPFMKEVLTSLSRKSSHMDYWRLETDSSKDENLLLRQKVVQPLRFLRSMVQRADILEFVPNAKYNNVANYQAKDFRAFHVVRDPRDVIVSGYFSHRYSHPVDNPWGERYLKKHREWLNSVSKDEGLLEEIRQGYALNRFKTWDFKNPSVLEMKFENLTADPFTSFVEIFAHLELALDNQVLEKVIEKFSFERMTRGRSKGEENVHSHFRKGTPGDWRNHFNDEHIALFKLLWGDLLISMGYEANPDWE